MAARDFDSFLDAPDEYAALTEEQQAALFAGKTLDIDVGGDASDTNDGDTDNDAQSPATEEEAAPSASDKELAETREQARFWREMAAKQRAEQDVAATQEDEPPPEKPAEVDLDELEMLVDDARDAGDTEAVTELRKQIRAENERRAEARVTERIKAELLAERQAEKDAAIRAEFDAEAKRIWAEHPSLDHNKPDANPRLIAKVTAVRNLLIESEGMSPAAALKAAVDDVMGKPGDPPATLTAEQKAAAAIAKAQKKPPTSMGDIPAASIPNHDEADVVANMTPAELSRKMDSMTPEQIEAFVARHT